MIRLIALYGHPADRDAFDRHYRTRHVPLVLAMPHLRGFEVSTGPVLDGDGDTPYHLVAVMSYDSSDDLDASLKSPEGVAAVDDLANFADGGVTVLTVETEPATGAAGDAAVPVAAEGR